MNISYEFGENGILNRGLEKLLVVRHEIGQNKVGKLRPKIVNTTDVGKRLRSFPTSLTTFKIYFNLPIAVRTSTNFSNFARFFPA